MDCSGEGHGTPLQYSCLENPMDRGAWQAAVHEVAKSRTWLSDFTFTFHFHALEKKMATYSSVLAWRNPGMGEPGGLPSLESHRVGHDWRDLAAAAWTAACQAPLSSAVSHSVFQFMSIELVVLSNHLTLCHPLLFVPSIFLSFRVFSSESTLCTKWTLQIQQQSFQWIFRVGFL